MPTTVNQAQALSALQHARDIINNGIAELQTYREPTFSERFSIARTLEPCILQLAKASIALGMGPIPFLKLIEALETADE